MESRQLRHFYEVASCLSFTRAAQNLNIAQPALSISIKKLEQQLGIVLFHREDKQIALTEEGRVLLHHAEQVLRDLADAQLAMNELTGLEKGEVRIGAPSMIASYYLPPLLMAFKNRYPKLKLTIIDAGTQLVQQMLLKGEIDLGVVVQDSAPDALQCETMIDAEMVAVSSDSHPFVKKKSVSFEEFFDEELVMFKPGYFHRNFLDQIAVSLDSTPKIGFETNLLPFILNVVKHEFAVTALLKLVTDNEPGLVATPFKEPVYFNLVLAHRKNGYLSKADRAFLEFVKSNRR